MKLVHGPEIKKVLHKVQPRRIAAAYVGADWESFIDVTNLEEIIVSPTAGSSAEAIGDLADRIGWDNVHFLDELHAKLYLGDTSAAIGSFNLTANGLSGHALAEAGYVVDAPGELRALGRLYADFKLRALSQYSSQARKEFQLSRLREINGKLAGIGIGYKAPAQVRTLADYRPLTNSDFYCAYYTDEGLELNVATLRKKKPEKFRSADSDPDELIKSNLPFLPKDRLLSGHWILMWKAWAASAVPAKLEAEWMYIHDVIRNGAIDPENGYTKLAVQWKGARGFGAPPFKLGVTEKEALRQLFLSKSFPEFFPAQDGRSWSLNQTSRNFKAFITEWKRLATL
jgi:hypothetical protein